MPNLENFPIFTHAEETDELLGKPPAWLLRSGISVIFLIIIAFFTLSWFIKYPEVVVTQATFTTYNPPVSLVARSNGKIQHIFVKANDSVKAGQIVATMENAMQMSLSSTDKLSDLLNPNDKMSINLGEL